MSETAYVGFGGNVGDVRATLAKAITHYCDGTAVKLLARSSDYRTPPWGNTDQPPFINLCLAIETTLEPEALLDHGLAVERAFGRDRAREERWGPRTLDIDVLSYGNRRVDTPRLTLPHPRLTERAFVLVPLAEIRPELQVGGTTVGAALAKLDTAGIQRLSPLT
ncbi:2-amino-4-hydroxy-6-hydroxymethyldihydropteridine pyrophosphokinase [Variibacter gotjawalensis]|uniref:2-amino-4-hydroxy-6-hydroxymethyldihydropteridine pyrophosphokinase n=1 Tax=Variibacter gotjawalensis TaxID=1333996 RepID=A0A0S3PZX7_9BRAD|nr:2-amino-4-hydroxy-6-hydroxymethyldihydropteridine diphosphokinase [Variibacter gotjawalensis]NIK47118.1 2-amino-4-hydroxy-6-hydroxymethyldihydropteridine diphosphokinase [Variibacter gotjawalensis]RZS49020.1 2-amino-4-hydroxy-6-hydroxymethyldihydropteridine diphosphokinase [Variibacter gotjawalensis]BAT61280.1 2-amino-4-hydroxy-6-hydroxymethyldihydropteridine pyrophosphokinase [Variibacter gotjawalensis]